MAKQMGNQYADSDPVSPSPQQIGNVGDSVSDGMQFADNELTGNARYRQNRIINSDDSDYAGQPSQERTVVSVDRADRGRES